LFLKKFRCSIEYNNCIICICVNHLKIWIVQLLYIEIVINKYILYTFSFCYSNEKNFMKTTLLNKYMRKIRKKIKPFIIQLKDRGNNSYWKSVINANGKTIKIHNIHFY